MNIPAAGVAGFVGSHVVESYLSAGFEVCAADDLSTGFWHNRAKGLRNQEGNRLRFSKNCEVYRLLPGVSSFSERHGWKTKIRQRDRLGCTNDYFKAAGQ
jgi:nucleoside-diphosphate-sugar epimerase